MSGAQPLGLPNAHVNCRLRISTALS
jgi:hypothetical protein